MRHLITGAFLLLAIGLYSLGAAGPATGLLVAGVVAEGVFWYRLFGRRSK
jgi:hypothetical protein